MNETGRETLLWKACSEQIRLQVGRFGGLDTKGGIILGFVAAALGGILSQLIRAASERPEWFANWSRLRGISFVLGVSLTLGMIFLLLAACFAVCVLWPRNISMGSDLDWVRAEMESALQEQRDSGDSVKKFEAPYAEELAMLQSWKANKHSIDTKATWVGRCSACVGAAVIFLVLSGGLIVVEGVRSSRRQSPALPAEQSLSSPNRPASDSTGKPPLGGAANHRSPLQSPSRSLQKPPLKTSVPTSSRNQN